VSLLVEPMIAVLHKRLDLVGVRVFSPGCGPREGKPQWREANANQIGVLSSFLISSCLRALIL